MTVIVQITQATKPILPPKNINLFCDDYLEDRIEIYTDNSFFVVEHCTTVEKELIEFDGFSHDYGHYTSSNGHKYSAYTAINSIKILISDGMTSECVMSQLPEDFISKIKTLIESLAEKYAKDADDE